MFRWGSPSYIETAHHKVLQEKEKPQEAIKYEIETEKCIENITEECKTKSIQTFNIETHL